MSYSSGPGRSFGGRRLAAREKKKKQEFHKHKIKFSEEGHVDFENLKMRVATALDKLGHQQFSTEPGGYTFHNWMTSFNLLLDDFEEKAGPTNLPKEYYDKRQKLTADLVKPPDNKELDEEIKKIESEIELVRLRIASLNERTSKHAEQRRNDKAKRIEHLKEEQSESQRELEDAEDELEKGEKKKSRFGRLFSGTTSLEKIRNKISSLRARNQKITKEIHALETKSNPEEEQIDAEMEDQLGVLEELNQKIANINLRKEEKSQLQEQRVKTTQELSEIIASIKLTMSEEKISEENQ
jgi:DNA repair exonuclease SbcCD ATPase subunit